MTYNGEEMTEYDATQKQREMERRIRATKRELAGYDAGINATDNESLKADLQAAFDRKSVLLKKQEAALKDFTKQTGLIRDRSREQVSAHFDTTKWKVDSFNKSVTQNAVQSDRSVYYSAKKILKSQEVAESLETFNKISYNPSGLEAFEKRNLYKT